MPTAFWKYPFLKMASSIWALPEEKWIDDSPTKEDMNMLEKYALMDSATDEVNFRKEVFDAWKQKEKELFVKTLPGRTRVVFLGTLEQFQKIPWAFWARIFQSTSGPIGRILFYGNEKNREFPNDGTPLRACHINGGFTYLCEREVIVIYRYEEATRVLLHEIMHTECFDSEKSVEELEAYTQAWTELFLCALKSKGTQRRFLQLWKEQVSWMSGQTEYIQKNMNVNSKHDYAWRYMSGKQEVLEQLGFFYGIPRRTVSNPITPRLTSPLLE